MADGPAVAGPPRGRAAHARSISSSIGRSATPPVQLGPSTRSDGHVGALVDHPRRRGAADRPRRRAGLGHGRRERVAARRQPVLEATGARSRARRPRTARRIGSAPLVATKTVWRTSLRNATLNIAAPRAAARNSTSMQAVQRSPCARAQDPLAARRPRTRRSGRAPRASVAADGTASPGVTAEVDLVVALGDVLRVADREHPAALEQHRAVAEALDRAHVVGHEQDRPALLAHARRTRRSTSAGTRRRRRPAPRRPAGSSASTWMATEKPSRTPSRTSSSSASGRRTPRARRSR